MTLDFLSFENRQNSRVAPFVQFTLFIGGQLALLLLAFRFAWRSVWNAEISAGIWWIAITFVICHFVICIAEHLFHRYFLHLSPVKFLKKPFADKHDGTHHSLTSIRFVAGRDDGSGTIRSLYPIMESDQAESATFPSWAFPAAWAAIAPPLIILAWLIPWAPILIGGTAAIAFHFYLYETAHVIYHLPFSWWEKRMRGKYLGAFWRARYELHIGHHANSKCNEAVVGFFFIPAADLLFGTYKRLPVLLVDGAAVSKEDILALTPKPRWPISWLDRVAEERERKVFLQLSARR